MYNCTEMGVGWFWDILELIRAADVGPAEQQARETNPIHILESSPDFPLKCSLKVWKKVEPLHVPDIVIL